MYAVVAVLSHLTHSPLVAMMKSVAMNIFFRSAEIFPCLRAQRKFRVEPGRCCGKI